MKVLTSKVVKGQLDVPAGTLQEGETVTLLVPDTTRRDSTSPRNHSERFGPRIAESERGESVDGWHLLD